MVKNGIAAGFLLFSSIASAQSGWSRAGAAIGGSGQRSQNAYESGVMYGAELRYLQENAKAAKMDADRMDAEASLRLTLTKAWIAGGLSDEEALSVAAVYRIKPEQQAILDRARRQGPAPTIADAWKAYKQYNYLLADQLVVAALVVNNEKPAK